MTSRMNRQFAALEPPVAPGDVLEPALQQVVEATLVATPHGWILDGLPRPQRDADLGDATGWQAVATRFHVEELLGHCDGGSVPLPRLVSQAVSACRRLAERLAPLGPHRVVLSVDPEWPTASVRFFQRRADQPWGDDDLEAYTLEAVFVIDTPG